MWGKRDGGGRVRGGYSGVTGRRRKKENEGGAKGRHGGVVRERTDE